MARIKAVHRPGDYAGDPADVDALFATLFPGVESPAFDANHDGMAIAALNPKLALTLAQASRFMALDLGWCQRADLRELAILTVNTHYRSAYSLHSRVATVRACGISDAQTAALSHWHDSPLFDDAQRLVIEYSLAVVSGDVPAALFDRVKTQFGETGAVECTAVIGFWSFWAMFLNATRPEVETG